MLNLQPSSFEDFEREAERGNVVPIIRSVLADLQTPVGAFMRLVKDARFAFLLESVEGGERIARYSFLGVEPATVIRGRGNNTLIESNGKSETLSDINAVDFLRAHFRNKKLAHRRGLAPMAGGAVGYLSYDAARWFEPVLENGKLLARNQPIGDDAVWMLYRTVLAFDRLRQLLEITTVVFTDEAAGDRDRLKQLYDRAVGESERIEDILQGSIIHPRQRGSNHDVAAGSFQSEWTRPEFLEAVEKIKRYITAGDCYQAVLSQRFSKIVTASPISIYRALRATNPSPYTFFLKLGDESIIGASPEMLVRCRGDRLDYRPIAGTRKRGETEAEDQALGEELRLDEKEVAEHTMLVDLGRNDLGQVSEYGSVEVETLMDVERYSHVQHLVTSLTSKLRGGLDRFDALASCFPAGTVTGAPKVRAMEIIRELEPSNRGVYAGTVLYTDYAGNLDSCIAIRTMVISNGRAFVQAGAGIVADSVPELEYEETINKGAALFRAVEVAERGL